MIWELCARLPTGPVSCSTGKIVEHGPTAEIFANPQHAYTQHLLSAEPKGKPPKADLDAPVVMQGENIKVWFPIKKGFLRKTVDHVKAVDGIDLILREGQTLGVVGESGSGKTTLGMALTELIPVQGRIVFLGDDINENSFREMRHFRGTGCRWFFRTRMDRLARA